MRKVFIICIIALVLMFSSVTSYSATSDKQLAQNWVNNHGGGYTIEKVITVSKGGKKGIVKGTSYVVKYPKKVKKGKRVTCYMIEKNGDVCAMVACGKVK